MEVGGAEATMSAGWQTSRLAAQAGMVELEVRRGIRINSPSRFQVEENSCHKDGMAVGDS